MSVKITPEAYAAVATKRMGYDHACQVAERLKAACKASQLPDVKASYEFWTHVLGTLKAMKQKPFKPSK